MTQTTATKQYAYKKARGFMAEQLKQVNDRPAMPEALCLKLVQSLIDDGSSFEAKIGVIDSTPILALYLKEAGFTNITLLNNKEARYRKVSTRIWVDDVKGFCTNNKIQILGFGLNMTDKPKFDIVIGNPPYGRGASLAIKFLNKAFELSNDVRFVLPRSLRKDSLQNRVSLSFSCVYDETLPASTFQPATSNTKACYQIWQPQTRLKKKLSTTHSDWKDLKWEEKDQAALMVRTQGTRAGVMFTAEEMKQYKCGGGHNHFISASPKVVARLLTLQDELMELGKESNNQESIGRYQIVQLYIKHFS